MRDDILPPVNRLLDGVLLTSTAMAKVRRACLFYCGEKRL